MINEILYEAGILARLAETGIYETIAGAVHTIYREVDSGGDEYAVQTFPATCMEAATGGAGGEYSALTPDDGKTSVGFFEGGPAVYNMDGRKTEIRANVRFLAWYNLNRLYNGNTCYLPLSAVHATVAALEGTFQHAQKPGISAAVSITQVHSDGNGATAFRNYSFAEQPHLFTAPFAWAVYDMRITINYQNICLVPLQAACSCNIL